MSKTEDTKRATRASAKTTRFGSFVRLDPRAASTRTLPPVSCFHPGWENEDRIVAGTVKVRAPESGTAREVRRG